VGVLKQRKMSYYVTTKGKGNVTLFLVDRSKTKQHWWTLSLINAMSFRNESAAEYSAKRLRYKTPSVVNSKEAKILENENDFKCEMMEEHPFSSDAIAQF
jgi:hypothetical protein